MEYVTRKEYEEKKVAITTAIETCKALGSRKEYEEKKVALEKELDKYHNRIFWGVLGMGGSGAVSVYIFNTIPLKVIGFLSAVGFASYTLFGPITKSWSAINKLQKLKAQRLSELEQRVGEE